MKQKFDANTTIKGIRWMAFGCSGLSFMYLATAFYFLSLDSAHKGTTSIPFVLPFLLTAGALGPVCGALHGVFHVFRYQQSKIENLKAAIERLQSDSSPVESMTAPQIEGVTTT